LCLAADKKASPRPEPRRVIDLITLGAGGGKERRRKKKECSSTKLAPSDALVSDMTIACHNAISGLLLE
jgi:hypothetical protein